MGHLSTHVLDTMHGCPAAGMHVRLLRIADGLAQTIALADFTLNADGRNEGGPLLIGGAMRAGCYRLVFGVGRYFRAKGVALSDPAFLEDVAVDFGIADAAGHYHVPLLASPWAYSTYRGS
jgi:5-hydroxyisourate hydrolase